MTNYYSTYHIFIIYSIFTLQQKGTDGWDDFEIDEEESHPKPVTKTDSSNMAITEKLASTNIDNVKINSKDTGWDDFDDWGDSTDNKEV